MCVCVCTHSSIPYLDIILLTISDYLANANIWPEYRRPATTAYPRPPAAQSMPTRRRIIQSSVWYSVVKIKAENNDRQKK